MGNRSRVHDSLGEFRGVFADVRERGRGDALQRQLGLLNAENQEGNRSSVDNRLKIVVNGLKNLTLKLKELDPITYKKIDLNNHRRIIRALEVSISSNKPYSSFLNNSEKQSKYNEIIIGLDCDRPKLHSLINSRVDIMIKKGLVDEVNTLIKYKKLNALNTIGYKEIFEYLENKINLEEAIDKIKTNSRRYAKRQLTWFKSNKKVNWYSYDYDLKVILNMIKSFQSIQQST